MKQEKLMDLRIFLLKKKITHEDFAKKLGISRSTLHRIMVGDTDPPLSLAIKIVKATKGAVSYEELITQQDAD